MKKELKDGSNTIFNEEDSKEEISDEECYLDHEKGNLEMFVEDNNNSSIIFRGMKLRMLSIVE